MAHDRRKRRAVAPLLALEYLLDAERARAGASALGVFEQADPLATSATDGDARRDLVAFASGAASDRDAYVLGLDVGGPTWTLVSLDKRVRSLRRVEESVKRILSTA